VQFDATVPTFEDKVAQRAIVMVLELVYVDLPRFGGQVSTIDQVI
jgi:hypothetical protein